MPPETTPPTRAARPGASWPGILIARIGAAHGVAGEVRLRSFAEDPTALDAYGPLSTRDGRRLVVERLCIAKTGALVAKFRGVADRTAAERLNGLELFADRAALPPAGADEFYHVDLIGLHVIDPGDRAVGTVIAVHNHGAGDILEIAPPRGETLLLPFTRAAFPEIDLAEGRILVMPPEEIEVRGENAEDLMKEP